MEEVHRHPAEQRNKETRGEIKRKCQYVGRFAKRNRRVGWGLDDGVPAAVSSL